MRGSPRATPSGIWCPTGSCATSTSASCTAASEPRGVPVNDRYDAGYGDDQYELVGYDEYGQPVYRQVPQVPPRRCRSSPTTYGQQGSRDSRNRTESRGTATTRTPWAGSSRRPPTTRTTPVSSRIRRRSAAAPATTPGSTRTARRLRPHGAATQALVRPLRQTATQRQQRPRVEQPRAAEQTAYIPQQAGPVETGASRGGPRNRRPGVPRARGDRRSLRGATGLPHRAVRLRRGAGR